jgi:integrase
MPPDLSLGPTPISPQAEAFPLTIHQAVVESPPAPAFADQFDAASCTSLSVSSVEVYVQSGIAQATRRAYRADLDHFEAWGGTIPATDDMVAAYIADHAAVLKVSTLTRRLAAISIAHGARGLPNPAASPLVRATMRGIRRAHGAAQRQAKPLLREDLFVVLGAMGDRLKDLRDRALLLIGFAGGLRRSELAAINFIDVERVREGIILIIRRSKTDQDGVGRRIGVPFGRTIHCPVRALETWLSAARIEEGPIFRPVDRHGRVSVGRLSGEAVSLIIRDRLTAAGFDPAGYSGHSLRAGFATSATPQAGVLDAGRERATPATSCWPGASGMGGCSSATRRGHHCNRTWLWLVRHTLPSGFTQTSEVNSSKCRRPTRPGRLPFTR